MPYANAEAMQKHLEEISRSIAAKAHGVIIMDGAGWHKSGALKVPKNLSILFLRQTYLSNRVFENWEEIVDACCDAWNRLTTDTGRIKSIATRNWATTGQ